MVESERALSRCSAHGLSYDPRVAAGCVLCQRERRSKAAPNASGRTSSAVALVAVLAVIFGGTWFAYSKGIWGNVDAPRVATVFDAVLAPTAPPSATSAARLPAFGGEFTARNASGRSGYFFVPARASTGALPLMVLLHGTGGDGRDMISAFRDLAAERGFVLAAPSSDYVEEGHAFNWRVGDHPRDFSDDYDHVLACVAEIRARRDLSIDPARVLIAGFSGGASSAPYIASNAEPFTEFAVLHGGVFVGGIGPRKVPGWFSTGDSDPARPPAHVLGHFNSMQQAGFDVVFRTFPGAHVLSSIEKDALVAWWLGDT